MVAAISVSALLSAEVVAEDATAPAASGAKFEHFVAAVAQAKDGKIAVMTFHGVPDEQHPWVNTDPAVFEKYLAHLKEQGCTVIAVRDMVKYLPAAK